MTNGIAEKSLEHDELAELAGADIAGYFIFDKAGTIKQSRGHPGKADDWEEKIQGFLGVPDGPESDIKPAGVFYRIINPAMQTAGYNRLYTLYLGPLPESEDNIGIVYNSESSIGKFSEINPETIILSLIAQAVRAFNKAENLETILKIVLIGVTAGCGLGFNRAFILLTCDEENCLRGALANGPSSPEEANIIWRKLSKGEITLEKMFDDALKNGNEEDRPLNGFLKNILIPLNNKDNIFVKAALGKKSMIIDEITLASEEYSNLHSMIGPGPLAVVPLIGQDYLQGVLIADNFITRKEITENDLQLLEIFARYASDSIKNFRLYDRLGKKVDALKRANETIISSRENVIKAERLSVLAEMAGEVAHEVRNPLTIIGGFAKSMLKKMPENDINHENLKIIFSQVERISQSLEKFTSLINYESSNDKICNLGELVKSAIEVRIPGTVFSKFKVLDRGNIAVKTDPDLLRQAFIIILKHVNSMNSEIPPIILLVDRKDNRAFVYFDTEDSEIPFAGEIYRSFHKGSNHEQLKQLSTTLEILKYYRGNIGIEASENGRNRFYVELPLYEEEQ